MTNYILIVLGLTLICSGLANMILGHRVSKLSDILDRVRFGTVELVNGLQAEIADLRDSLRDAGIPLCDTQMRERMRRMSLSPEERYRESQERWEAAVAEVEMMKLHLDAEAEKEWRKHDGLD